MLSRALGGGAGGGGGLGLRTVTMIGFRVSGLGLKP